MKKFLLTAVMLCVGVCFLGCEQPKPAKKEEPKAPAAAAAEKKADAPAAPAAPAPEKK